MFDTINNPVRTEYVTKNVNVTEKKAPTDESVRLLMEMEEKVLQRFLGKMIVNDNSINLELASFFDITRFDKIVYYRLTINGKQYQDKVDLRIPINGDSIDYIIQSVVDSIAKTIAIVLFNSIPPETIKKELGF